ncbi:hypothetical protein [Bordetella genomosp. 5]|uniref:hypothetical protein n=1 Tax=Bordetella genomosp. 5 TaxID=1395608 RepID=UPI0011402638|nr:hypothetical protein [Bordetella genomosp. 5]
MMPKYPFSPRSSPDGTFKPESDEGFRERAIAYLKRKDAGSRSDRANRLRWISEQHINVGYLGRAETAAIFEEARSSYVHGNFIATLILALAYAEHVINDALPPRPSHERSPTLASAVNKARAAKLFPDDLLDEIAVMNDFRNPFVHRRSASDPDTIGQRVSSRKSHPATILEQDARDALLIMYSFFRHSFTPTLSP